jgi:hypothetical protein
MSQRRVTPFLEALPARLENLSIMEKCAVSLNGYVVSFRVGGALPGHAVIEDFA